MFKFALSLVGAMLFAGMGFTVGGAMGADQPAAPAASAPAIELNESIGCPGCNHAEYPDSATVATSAPAEAPKAVDVKNTKCPVTGEDVSNETLEYNGKIYHMCCGDCAAEFKKDPDKYVKAMAADPAKYGIPK